MDDDDHRRGAGQLVSLVGVLALLAREAFLRRALPVLVGFAVGALLGDALLHILPELAERAGPETSISMVVVGSIIFFFASALAALFGGVLELALEGAFGGLERPLLAMSAGAFIYIAGADLIPELHRVTDVCTSFFQFVGVTGGFGAMAALLLVE